METVPAVCPLCPPGTARTAVASAVDFEYGTSTGTFTFKRCDGCGVVLLDPRPADSVIPGLYPENYLPYRFDQLPLPVRATRDFVQRRKVSLLKRLALPGAHIVDLGCGGGALLTLLRKHGDPSWQLAGWDFPGPHLDHLERAGFEVFRGGTLPDLIPDESVDLFILNQVVEHFPEPAQVLSVLRRALKPGGLLLIETPDLDGLDARLFARRYWGGYHCPRHMVLFNAPALEQLLGRHGFSVVSRGWLTSPSFWIQSVHHCLSEVPALRRLAKLFEAWNPLALAAATLLDLMRLPLGPTSNLRLVARKDSEVA